MPRSFRRHFVRDNRLSDKFFTLLNTSRSEIIKTSCNAKHIDKINKEWTSWADVQTRASSCKLSYSWNINYSECWWKAALSCRDVSNYQRHSGSYLPLRFSATRRIFSSARGRCSSLWWGGRQSTTSVWPPRSVRQLWGGAGGERQHWNILPQPNIGWNLFFGFFFWFFKRFISSRRAACGFNKTRSHLPTTKQVQKQWQSRLMFKMKYQKKMF